MATTEDMEEMVLGCCGVAVWYPRNFLNDKRKTKDTFYCPNGHARSYAESTADRLQKKLDAATASLADKTAKIDKLKDGRCPFCWKTVKHLNAHINSQH